jgi:hypothetical protein
MSGLNEDMRELQEAYDALMAPFWKRIEKLATWLGYLLDRVRW